MILTHFIEFLPSSFGQNGGELKQASIKDDLTDKLVENR